MPAVCWNTPCTPQKHPPASTAVCRPSDGCASTAGGGITTASSAARDGAEAKAKAASAPIAAAQSERRLKVVWRMGVLCLAVGRVDGEFKADGAIVTTGVTIGRRHPVISPEDTALGLKRYALADTTA